MDVPGILPVVVAEGLGQEPVQADRHALPGRRAELALHPGLVEAVGGELLELPAEVRGGGIRRRPRQRHAATAVGAQLLGLTHEGGDRFGRHPIHLVGQVGTQSELRQSLPEGDEGGTPQLPDLNVVQVGQFGVDFLQQIVPDAPGDGRLLRERPGLRVEVLHGPLDGGVAQGSEIGHQLCRRCRPIVLGRRGPLDGRHDELEGAVGGIAEAAGGGQIDRLGQAARGGRSGPLQIGHGRRDGAGGGGRVGAARPAVRRAQQLGDGGRRRHVLDPIEHLLQGLAALPLGLDDGRQHDGGGGLELVPGGGHLLLAATTVALQQHDDQNALPPGLAQRSHLPLPVVGAGGQVPLDGRGQRVEQTLPAVQVGDVGRVHDRAAARLDRGGHLGDTAATARVGDDDAGSRGFLIVVATHALAKGRRAAVLDLVILLPVAGDAEQGAEQDGAAGAAHRPGREEGGRGEVAGALGLEVGDYLRQAHGEAGGRAGHDVRGGGGGGASDERGCRCQDGSGCAALGPHLYLLCPFVVTKFSVDAAASIGGTSCVGILQPGGSTHTGGRSTRFERQRTIGRFSFSRANHIQEGGEAPGRWRTGARKLVQKSSSSPIADHADHRRDKAQQQAR